MVGKCRDTNTYSKMTLVSFVMFICSVLLYLYFLNMSVVEVVMRSNFIEQQQVTSGKIAVLESEYIDAQHQITKRVTSVDVYDGEIEKYFVSRTQASLVSVGN